MFVFKSVTDMSIIDVYNATWPFVAVIMVGLAGMALAPDIVMFFPRLMN